MIIKILIFVCFILLGKISGFAKDLFLSFYYGVSPVTEAYVLSNTIASTIYIGIYSSIPLIVIPFYSGSERDKNNFPAAFKVFISYLAISILLCASIFVFYVANKLFPNFNVGTADFEVVLLFLLIAAVSFPLSTTSNFFNSLLSVHGRKQWIYIVAIINNIVFCIAIYFFSGKEQFPYVLFAGVLSWFALSFFAAFSYFKLNPIKDWHFIEFKKNHGFIKKAAGTIVFSYLDQLLITAAIFASSIFIYNGASIFNYSYKVIALFSSAISLVMTSFIFTKMSRYFNASDRTNLKLFFMFSFDCICRIIIPLSVILSLSSELIVVLIFERGAFTREVSIVVGKAMQIFFICLPFIALRELLLRFMFAISRQRDAIASTLIGFVSFATIMLSLLVWSYNEIVPFAYVFGVIGSSVYLIRIAPLRFPEFDIASLCLPFIYPVLFSILIIIFYYACLYIFHVKLFFSLTLIILFYIVYSLRYLFINYRRMVSFD